MSKIQDQNQTDAESGVVSDADPEQASAPQQAEVILFRPAGAKRAHQSHVTAPHNAQDDGDDPGPSAA